MMCNKLPADWLLKQVVLSSADTFFALQLWEGISVKVRIWFHFQNWKNEGDFGGLGLRNALAQLRTGTHRDEKVVVKCVISAILAG